MRKKAFIAELDAMGMDLRDAVEELGIVYSTATRWEEVPSYALAYLRLRAENALYRKYATDKQHRLVQQEIEPLYRRYPELSPPEVLACT